MKYSLQQHHGQWVMRWSVYKNGKRTQPTHIVASVKAYKKKADVKPLADACFIERVQKSRTVQAGASLNEFVTVVFFPHCKARLKSGTLALYKQQWKRLEPHLGSIRLRDVMTPQIQAALDSIHDERKETISHDTYMLIKVTVSAIFSLAIRRGDHPGPNPEDHTSVRGYGHKDHRKNGASDLSEIKRFFLLFPTGDTAVAIAVNAFLALRKPEVESLRPEDFDPVTNLVRIHRNTKTSNDEKLPVVGPLREIMAAGGWNQINLRIAERTIVKRLQCTTLEWKGWYAFRRGMLTNLWKLGVRVEEAAMILRNSPEVCRRHYLRCAEAAMLFALKQNQPITWDCFVVLTQQIEELMAVE